MEIKQLTSFHQIENIYKTRMTKDFPANERTPLPVLHKYWNAGEYQGYGLFDNEELLGYALFIIWQNEGENHYLFDYFAISEEHRDQGLGSLFLKGLAEQVTDAECMIGEVEDPEKAEDAAAKELRERRLAFYMRNGYLVTDVTARLLGMDYRLLEVPTGRPHSAEEIHAIYNSIYRHIAPGWFLKIHFETAIIRR